MEDNIRKRPKDYSKVDVNDPDGILYWTMELGVSQEVIIATVKRVGTSLAAVRRNIKLDGGNKNQLQQPY